MMTVARGGILIARNGLLALFTNKRMPITNGLLAGFLRELFHGCTAKQPGSPCADYNRIVNDVFFCHIVRFLSYLGSRRNPFAVLCPHPILCVFSAQFRASSPPFAKWSKTALDFCVLTSGKFISRLFFARFACELFVCFPFGFPVPWIIPDIVRFHKRRGQITI